MVLKGCSTDFRRDRMDPHRTGRFNREIPEMMNFPKRNSLFTERLRLLVGSGASAIANILDSATLSELQSLPPELWQQLIVCGQGAKEPTVELRIARALAFIPAAAADRKTRDYLVDLDEGGIFVGLAFHVSGWRRERLVEYMVRTHPEYAGFLLHELLLANEQHREATDNDSSLL